MSESNAFARIVAVAVVLSISVMAGCVATGNIADNKAITQMVASGADPLASRCAIRPEEKPNICVVLAAKR